MQHHEGKFNGHRGLKIYYQYWAPEDSPRAVIMIAHGLGEYSDYYSSVADYLVPKGFAVWALDHRGHGRSEGERIHFEEFHDYAIDLKTLFDLVRQNNPGKKVFLIGHSGGSIISLDFTLEFQHELAGLIISGGGPAKPGENLITAGQPLNVTGNHRDPKIVARHLNDPLCYHGLINEQHAVLGTKKMLEIGEKAHMIQLPCLLLAGTAQLDGERGKALYAIIGAKDKTLKLYEGLPHDLFNDPDCLMVLADLEKWLNAHI